MPFSTDSQFPGILAFPKSLPFCNKVTDESVSIFFIRVSIESVTVISAPIVLLLLKYVHHHSCSQRSIRCILRPFPGSYCIP